MKVIIVGLGKVGRKILQCLSEESHNIIAIDLQAEKVQSIVEKYDVIGLCGNGCVAENLKEAGATNADLLIAVTPSDEQNVLCCMIAETLGVKNTIARVRDPEYNGQADFMCEKFGIDRFVNPEKALSEEITRILKFPSAEKVHTFADGRAEIVEMRLLSDSSLVGQKIRDIKTHDKKYAVLIAAIERGGEVIVPNGDTVLESGDVIGICAKHTEISDFLRTYGLLNKKVGYVMILGADRKAYYLANNLDKFGFTVKVISPNMEKCEIIREKLDNVSVVCGDFNDRDVLETEGISEADAVVAMTDYDENNIMISLYAKKKGIPKIITLVHNGSYENILDDLALDTIVSPYQVVADDTLRYLRSVSVPSDSRMMALYRLANDELEALQFNINAHKEFANLTLRELNPKLLPKCLVAAIIRGKTLLIPNGDTVIEENDSLIFIVSSDRQISSLDDLLR